MLGKLIKYDFKATAKSMVPFLLAVIGIAMLGTLALKAMISITSESVIVSIVMTILTLFGVMILVALYAAVFVGIILIVRRYYTDLMTDEGYLAHTLPVSAGKHVWSKLITAMLWSGISFVVILLCIAMVLLFGTSGSFINQGVIDEIVFVVTGFTGEWTVGLTLLVVLLVLLIFIAQVFQFLEIFFAITVGSLLTAKHKVLASVGIYFAINLVIGLVTSGVFAVLTFAVFDQGIQSAVTEMEVLGFVNPLILLYVVWYLAASVGLFIGCRSLLKNKLNLE